MTSNDTAARLHRARRYEQENYWDYRRDGCRDCDQYTPLDGDGRCDGCALAFARFCGRWIFGLPAR
jgi:hypothetical protein